MSYTITIEGAEQTEAKLAAIGTGLTDLTVPMREIGLEVAAYASGEGFASRGQVYGQEWAPLKTETAEYKAKRWPGRPPEVRTGEMQDSFGTEYGPMFVKILNKVAWFKFQQLGTSRGLPPRVMLALNDMLRLRIVTKLKTAILARMKGA